MTQTAVPAPSIRLTSFACPVCGAHSNQTWFDLHLTKCDTKDSVPSVWTQDQIEELKAQVAKTRDDKARAPGEKVIEHLTKMLAGEPFMEERSDARYYTAPLCNVFVSRCYTCGQLAIWLHDRLLYPPAMTAPPPNSDLSNEVRQDYDEARRILDLSPRGAAALLRLAIEKICIELGTKGKDINDQIADLVAHGLPTEVQQALDAVRVIGNEAVHPGKLDLRDDRDTVNKLFRLVNVIAEDRITRAKLAQEVYEMIPPEKRKAIEARDAKTAAATQAPPASPK
jgi:predicted RNA-binding Zn-ribbon protein involved in translation (DUF1610 family)